jgi:hypothetical protein
MAIMFLIGFITGGGAIFAMFNMVHHQLIDKHKL